MDNNIILYCHLFLDKAKGIFQTFKLNLSNFNTIHILDLKNLIEKEIEEQKKKENSTNSYTIQYLSKTIHSKSISDSIKICAFFSNKEDVFCCVSKSL